ncbi:hypothetical protein A2U01_0094487, partial [Trifolium medium]|nr:hypothetical protein [Trifolium medium]
DCSYELEQMSCELVEAWDLVCLMGSTSSYIDMVRWPMVAMDMPITAAVWDKLEWSIEAADKETEAIDSSFHEEENSEP